MASETEKRNIFPFFRLPRELRDCIYDECEGCVQSCSLTSNVGPLGSTHHVRVESWRSTKLLRISKQFAVEYKERRDITASLVIYEVGANEGIFCRSDLPKVLKDIKTVTLRLEVDESHLKKDMEVSLDFARSCMPCLSFMKNAVVTLEVFVHNRKERGRPLATFSDLNVRDEQGSAVALTKLNVAFIQVYIVVASGRRTYQSKNLQKSKDCVISDLATWTKTYGWVEKDGSMCSWK